MRVPFYLTVTKSGSVKTTKGKPDLRWDEIAIFVNLELPDGLFKKPQLQASIVVPDDAINPSVITTEMSDNIKEAIQQSTGLEVKLQILEPETT